MRLASPHSVLTFLSHRPVDGLVDNHARYAQLHGYRHVTVDGTHVYGERQPILHKYHVIVAQLVAMEPDALLLVLDPFSVVFDPHALQDVAQGYDAIVTTQTPKSALPAASGMIFRNVPGVREQLRKLVVELGKWAMYLPERRHACEATLLAEHFAPLPFDMPLANGHFASVQTIWSDECAIDSIAGARPLVAPPGARVAASGGRLGAGCRLRFPLCGGARRRCRAIPARRSPARNGRLACRAE